MFCKNCSRDFQRQNILMNVKTHPNQPPISERRSNLLRNKLCLCLIPNSIVVMLGFLIRSPGVLLMSPAYFRKDFNDSVVAVPIAALLFVILLSEFCVVGLTKRISSCLVFGLICQFLSQFCLYLQLLFLTQALMTVKDFHGN